MGWACRSRALENFENKMAEKEEVDMRDRYEAVTVNDTPIEVNSEGQISKKRFSESPSSAPILKSPRIDSPSPTTQTPNPEDETSETGKQEMLDESTERPTNPARRKSWRRATITRRSLPALPNPYRALSRNISPSLSQQERLERLLEASMKLALEKTQNSLQSIPETSLESFQKQVEHIHKKWSCMTKDVRNEFHKLPSTISSEPAVEKAIKNVQRTINRLRAESESWEALLSKHRSKAEELERKVERGQETGIPLSSTSMAQSSQCHVIQSKPDYNGLLCRQQPLMHTMEMIMDSQCKMIRQLLSIKEESQLYVKESSGRLAEEAGFQDLSSDLLRNLMSAPLPTT